jgi:hypothetical protein
VSKYISLGKIQEEKRGDKNALSLRTWVALPTFISITEGKMHDLTAIKNKRLPIMADSIISIDRAYIDFEWLNSLNKQGIFFVSRMKKNMQYRLIGQHKVDKSKGLLLDRTVQLINMKSFINYPDNLRLVSYFDSETQNEYTFLTNIFHLDAYTITQIYKQRWQIELFFKWIKQNLKIKSFLGTSKNAVMTQIWIAMCYFLLLAFIKFILTAKWFSGRTAMLACQLTDKNVCST